ncbi:hypothetical protein KUV57_13180 [Epibacterium sp. DP7N7-1]|nr:hypothetical protein [Epibacterium sp. DP7N7-1]
MGDFERLELSTGEGVLLLFLSEVTPDERDHLCQEHVQIFEGSGGRVCVKLVDNRMDLTRETGIFSSHRDCFSSISYSKDDVCRSVYNEVVPKADVDRRGRLIARMVEMSCRTPSVLRFCQRSLENITGALVSTSSISVDHVVDQLEDMLEGLEEDLLPPRPDDVHDLVVHHARDLGPDPEGIARDVAWTAIHKNMTRRS